MLKLSPGEGPHACSWLVFHVIGQASLFLLVRRQWNTSDAIISVRDPSR